MPYQKPNNSPRLEDDDDDAEGGNKKKQPSPAETWLKIARQLRGDNRFRIANMLHEVKEHGPSLKTLGVTEDDLDKLRTDGFLVEAKRWLGYLRNYPMAIHTALRLRMMHHYLDKACKTITDIGATEAEIEGFRKAA